MLERLTVFAGLAALVAAVLSAGACSTAGRAPAIQFELEPRPVFAQPGVVAARFPKLAVAASGALHLLVIEQTESRERLVLRISHDGGDSFGAPVPVSPAGAPISAHGENSPVLALTPTEIYVLWEQRRDDGYSDILVARSLDFGRSFAPPVSVVRKARPSFHGFANLAVAPDGAVYVAWLDGRDEPERPGTFSVYVAQSRDRGASFSEATRVAQSACPCCRVALAFGSHGEVHIAWRKVFEGDVRDIVVSTSTDRGNSFAPPVRVAADNWRIAGCPHSGPAIASKDGRLYLAWMTEAQGNSAVQVSWSGDAGKSFAPPQIVSGEVLDANHPSFSRSHDGRLLLVFEGRPVGQKDWPAARPYVAELTEDGRILARVETPPGKRSASYPVIGAGTAGRIYTAWTEHGHPNSRVLLSRGRASR